MSLVAEFTSALRHLRRSPGFSLLAVAMLALGIGANVAIFSLFRSIILSPLPYPEADRLVGLGAVNTAKALAMPSLSASDFRDFKENARAYAALAAFRPNFTSYRPTGGDAVQLVGALVTEDFFALFGLKPIRGRIFTPEEFSVEAARSVVISEGVWRRLFGEDPALLGRTILLDDQAVTVVGIMPAGFREPEFVDLWLPFPAEAPENLARDSRYWTTVGRLAPGVTATAAQAEAVTLAESLAREYPATNRGWSASVRPLLDLRVDGLRGTLLMLAGAVGLVLLVACVNLANLMLARGVSRLGEFAVRLALGASSGTLARTILFESLLLALGGGLLGTLLAIVGLPVLTGQLPPGIIPRSHAVAVDSWALAFALGVSGLTGLVFGLLPAWQVLRTNLNATLKAGGTRGGTGRFASRAQAALITGQLALTLMVLTGAALLARSLFSLQHTPVGFDARDVLTLRVAPPESRWQDFAALNRYYERLVETARRVPGVEAAAFDSSAPLCGISLRYPFWVRGRPRDEGNADDAVFNAVTPDFLKTLRLPLLRGRFIEPGDERTTRKVCVINQALAERAFPGEDPIGRHLQTVPFLLSEYREIVGVVADVRQDNLADAPPPQIYVPQAQSPWFFGTLLVRVAGGAARLGELQAALRQADPALPMDLVPLERNIARTATEPRLRTLLFGGFAAAALGLSAFGLYASMAFTTGQRVREIGVRMALGASPAGILGWMLQHAGRLCLAGTTLGLLGAVAFGRVLGSFLPGVTAFDPPVLLAVALFLPCIGLLAAAVPAWRASRLNPTQALQQD
ncbi:ABC transporter permease [Oleiharenicola lentus]|uniref:ABC transporter permease n=1 Tax=Oleiharenicola lentus TaxID=2508720 RepID=A0A4Q1C8D2_9BACT|nr:ABC transporter permease [Oleiharenicola lentus]RXK55205.1 ABC transporter permease [Oleiharenicola lentus]